MERNRRRVIVGTVVSTKNLKTITVEVSLSEKHPLYKKNFKSNQKEVNITTYFLSHESPQT